MRLRCGRLPNALSACREKKEKEALQQEAPLQLQPLQQAQLPKCVNKWRNAHVLAWLAFEVGYMVSPDDDPVVCDHAETAVC